MQNEQTKKTLTQLHEAFVAEGINKMKPITTKTGKKKAWYYNSLKFPQKLSPIERQCFADEFGLRIEDINWMDEPILIG
jgi:hypothetical protein